MSIRKSYTTYEICGGVFILIDTLDLKRVQKQTWHLTTTKGYAHQHIQTNVVIGFHKYKKMSLQRFLLSPESNQIAKLKDLSQHLDYRRSNLMVVSRQEQSRLCKKRKTQTSSIYRGVSFRSDRQKWAAMIQVDRNKHLLIGYFDCEHEAALEWNKMSRRYFGEIGFQNTVISKTVLTSKITRKYTKRPKAA